MSPIKGLSERRRLPRLGKIHLGVKVKHPTTGVEYPRAVDYFVCPEEVQKVFRDKPRELRILFPVEDEEKFAAQFYRRYSRSRGLLCKGDGETSLQLFDADTGAEADLESKRVVLKEGACKGRECPHYQAKECKEIMNLQFLLPEVPGLGVYQIDTGSINSILNINSAVELIRATCGRVAFIPLRLTLETQVATPNGKKKNIYTLNLRLDKTLSEMERLAAVMRETLAIPAPETPEENIPEPDESMPALLYPLEEEKPAVKSKPPEKPAAATPVTPTPSEKPKLTDKSKPGPPFANKGEFFTAAAARWPDMWQTRVLGLLNKQLGELGDLTEEWNTLLMLKGEWTEAPKG